MREILFRGQRIDNGEWVYGLPRFSKYFPEVEISAIEDENGNVYEDVNPETISQFTGLLDKNGNKIFEGDKVKFHYFYQGYINGGAIECEKEIDSVIEIRELGLFLKCENEDEGGYLLFYQPHEESFEIIGNIHENQ